MKASLLFILSLLIPALSHSANPRPIVSPERLDSIMTATTLTPIEGVWQFLPDNARIAIIRQPGIQTPSGPTIFNIYLYSTVSARLKPGTLIGTLYATPETDTFKADIAVNPLSKSASRQKQFLLKLKDPTHLTYTKINSGLSISLWRLIPYLFRVTVTNNKSRLDLDGCIKIKPLTPGITEPVRYL